MPKQTGTHEAELWLPRVIEWVRNPVVRDADGSVRVLDLSKGVTTETVLRHALGLADHEMTPTRRTSAGRIMRSLGFQWTHCRISPQTRDSQGKRECRYIPNYDVLGEYPDDD